MTCHLFQSSSHCCNRIPETEWFTKKRSILGSQFWMSKVQHQAANPVSTFSYSVRRPKSSNLGERVWRRKAQAESL